MSLLVPKRIRSRLSDEEIPKTSIILKKVLRISVPAALEYLLIGIIGILDMMMVGHYGEAETSKISLAAVAICQQPVFISLVFVFGINAGVTAIIARRSGENDAEEAGKTIRVALILGAVLGLAVTVFAQTLAKPFLHLLGAEKETIDVATDYFRIVSSVLVLNYLRLILCAALRAEGSTKITLITNIVANVVNLFLNYCLIYGKLGFPEKGVCGAAVATAVGNTVAFIIVIVFVFVRKGFVKLSFKDKWSLDKDNVTNLVRISTPAFIEQLFMRLGFFLIAMIVNHLGTETVAVNAVITGLISLAFNITDGFSTGAASLVGSALGSKEKKTAFVFARMSQILSFILGVIMSAIILGFRRKIAGLFSIDEAIINKALELVPWAILVIFPQSLQWVTTGALRGAGDVRFTARTSMLSVTIIRPVLAFILCYPLGLGLLGSLIGMFIDQTIRFLINNHRLTHLQWIKIEV